jgi:hypothetical protein
MRWKRRIDQPGNEGLRDKNWRIATRGKAGGNAGFFVWRCYSGFQPAFNNEGARPQ